LHHHVLLRSGELFAHGDGDGVKRLLNWPALLEAHLEGARKQTFSWGKWDCALAACDAIKAITGTDPGAPYRGKYSTEGGAATLAGATLVAFGAFVATATAGLAMPQVSVRHARRGDLVLCDNGTPQGALGIVDLSGRYAVCAGAKGLLKLRMSRWKKAWRVG
jgi:hypothetical protein